MHKLYERKWQIRGYEIARLREGDECYTIKLHIKLLLHFMIRIF